MNRGGTVGWGALVFLCVVVLPAGLRAAVELADEETYELAPGERLESELWLHADQATLAGEAGDDISLVAKTITLSGSFAGDIHALATEQLTFSGTAADQLRFIGLRIQIDGKTEKSLVALATSIAMTPETRLGDTAVLIADTVITDGEQEGPLWIMANKATIQGELQGDLHILADDIVIQPGTIIHGDVTYSSAQELTPGSKVTIEGELQRTTVAGPGLTFRGYLVILAAMFLSSLLAGLPLIRFFPRTFGLSAGVVRTATGRCVLTGMVAVWVLPLFIVAFLLVPLTLPLGLALLCGLGFFGFLSQIVIALVIGSLILRQQAPPSYGRISLTFFIGLLLLYILAAAPILNLMVWILSITLGLGGLITGILASQQLIGLKHAATGTDLPPDGPPSVPDSDPSNDLTQPKE